MPPLPPVQDERYQTLERLADGAGCSAHRARDRILEREITLVCCEDDAALEAFRRRCREVTRLADAIGIEVYDANPCELVLRSVDATTAERLLEYLAPDPRAADQVDGTGQPTERTTPALGVAAASALLLVVAGLLAIPGTSTGGTALAGELPAVVGVATEPPADEPLVTAAELRRTPMPEVQEPQQPEPEQAPKPQPPTAEPPPAEPAPAVQQERQVAAAEESSGPPAHARAEGHGDRGGPSAQGAARGGGNGR